MLWLLILPMWWGCRLVIAGVAAPPAWVANANPIWLAAAPYVWPGSVVLNDQVGFLGASLLASVGLSALAATQLRRVATPPVAIGVQALGHFRGPASSTGSLAFYLVHRSITTPFSGANGIAGGRGVAAAQSGCSTA